VASCRKERPCGSYRTAYHHAATAIAAEESLERKYRLEPGPIPKADHDAAEASLDQAMRQVAAVGGGADRELARVVLGEHDAYVAAQRCSCPSIATTRRW
jgi:hypothetical protein